MTAIVTHALAALFTLIGTCLAFLGETWRRDKVALYRRITRLGWLAIASLALAVVFNVIKEVQLSEEKELADRNANELSESVRDLTTEVRSTKERLSEAVGTLGEIAASQDDQDGLDSSALAAGTLDKMFNVKRNSVVKVSAVIGAALREKTGFLISGDGRVLTASFALTDVGASASEATDVTVETSEGHTYKAHVDYIDGDHSIAVLSTGIRSDEYLSLADRPPELLEEILVIGFTPRQFLTRTSGHITTIPDGPEAFYERDRDSLPGFGGGPVLDARGSVIGVNWGALDPPEPGRAKLIKSDAVVARLRLVGILPPS